MALSRSINDLHDGMLGVVIKALEVIDLTKAMVLVAVKELLAVVIQPRGPLMVVKQSGKDT